MHGQLAQAAADIGITAAGEPAQPAAAAPGAGTGPATAVRPDSRGAAGGPECDPHLTWDGRAQDGHFVPAGVYIFKLQAAGVILFKRVVFLGT